MHSFSIKNGEEEKQVGVQIIWWIGNDVDGMGDEYLDVSEFIKHIIDLSGDFRNAEAVAIALVGLATADLSEALGLMEKKLTPSDGEIEQAWKKTGPRT